MMHDKITMEIEKEALYQLLDHAKAGIQKTGDYTPMLAFRFKELLNVLKSDPVYANTHLNEFADSLDDTIDDGDEDYSFTLEEYDEYDDY